ncbi:uncharacterized protein LOC124163976 [Ischnura elegans]|uniref:uncharacterized protein LOC124163976 n=1 Tax=Ischnura elegans TaxID=197161 RepID=UPI001ED88EDE|nr:uncharacterized protein LOC124163976 [Ischnura elegans]
MAACGRTRASHAPLKFAFFVVFVLFPVNLTLRVCAISPCPPPTSFVHPVPSEVFSERRFLFSSFASCGLSLTSLHCPTAQPPRSRRLPRSPTDRPCPRLEAVILLLFLLSGDVQLNPGPSSVHFYYQNVRSIKNKLSTCDSHAHELSKLDIIALTETWLNPSVRDGELSFSATHGIHRKDRLSRGGGVLVAINNKFPSKRRLDLETECEIVWTEVSLPSNKHSKPIKTYVGCCYRPPASDLSVLERCLDSVMSVITPGPIILFGDFNLSIHWESPTSGSPVDAHDEYFLQNFIYALHLSQFCNEWTRNAATLDFLLSTIPPRQ